MNRRQVFTAAAAILVLLPVAAMGASGTGQWEVGIRDTHLRNLGAPDSWAAADLLGISTIEVQINSKMKCQMLFEGEDTPYSVETPEDRKALKDKLAEKKKSICAFCCGVRFGDPDSDGEVVEWLVQAAEAAKDLGIPIIMVPVPGAQGMKDDEYIARTTKLLLALEPIADKTGIVFAMENLQRFNNRKEILEPILKALKSPRVGLALDITNMYWYGYPVEQLYGFAELYAPYVRYVHAKNEKYPEDKKNTQREPGWEYSKYATSVREGDVDFRRILAILAKAGYRGPVTIEDDSLGHHEVEGKKKVLQDDAKFLREIFAELK